MPLFDAFVLDDNGIPQKLDMKGVVITTEEGVRRWLFNDGTGRPGYLKTHPELDGRQIHLTERGH